MKKILVIIGSAADRPCPELGDRTPLQVARLSEATRFATLGRGGCLAPLADLERVRPEALLARLMGVDLAAEAPRLAMGPLAARGAGISLAGCSFVFVGNLVTLDGPVLRDSLTPLSIEETTTLLEAARPLWNQSQFDLRPLGPGRLAVLCRRETAEYGAGLHPAQREGEEVDVMVPAGAGSTELVELLRATRELLGDQPVNDVRVDLGDNPANGLWLWGGGPPIRPLRALERVRPPSDLFTNSTWAQGLATILDMPHHEFPVAWPGGEQAPPIFPVAPLVKVLQADRMPVLYIEPPRDGGRFGSSPTDKVRALEYLDRHLLAPLYTVMEAYRPCRVILVAAGAGPVDVPGGDVPAAPLVISGDEVGPDDISRWDEASGRTGSLGSLPPGQVMELFNQDWNGQH